MFDVQQQFVGTSRRKLHAFESTKKHYYYIQWRLPRYSYRRGNFENDLKTFVENKMNELNGCRKIKLKILKGQFRNVSGKCFNLLRCDFKCKEIEQIGQTDFKFFHHRITCACRDCVVKHCRPWYVSRLC